MSVKKYAKNTSATNDAKVICDYRLFDLEKGLNDGQGPVSLW